MALKILGRSLVERQFVFAQERGWRDLNFVQTIADEYANDLGTLKPDGSESPALVVFKRDEEQVHLFWASEMSFDMADPGQDPRDAADIASLWFVLDPTPVLSDIDGRRRVFFSASAKSGFSGATLVRPGLERVRDLVAEGQIQTVLVLSPDRGNAAQGTAN